MQQFIEEILADIDWRLGELSTLKSIPIRYGFENEHKVIYVKYSIPAIYSIWEGFVKNCFTVYTTHLNTLSISRNEISLQLLTHQLDTICNFNNPRQHFAAKMKIVELIDNELSDIIFISPSVPTESNVNFKVLKKLLERFCIDCVDVKYSIKLDKLLYFRNTIAHGDCSLTVEMEHVNDFTELVENLMLDIILNIETNESNSTYKKS